MFSGQKQQKLTCAVILINLIKSFEKTSKLKSPRPSAQGIDCQKQNKKNPYYSTCQWKS